MFSTRTTGLPVSSSGLDSTSPAMPDWAVPTQKASTSSLVTPADPNASLDAATSSSSAPWSHRSPKRVQPMPTMATRSLMPCDAMRSPVSNGSAPDGPDLPEVVVDPVGRRQPAEGRLDAHPDRHPVGVGVGELDGQPPAAV